MQPLKLYTKSRKSHEVTKSSMHGMPWMRSRVFNGIATVLAWSMPLLADVADIRGQTTSTSLQPALENDLRRIESCNPYNYMAPAAEPLRRGPSLSDPNPYKYMTTPVVPAEPTPTRSRALARGRSALAEVQGALGPELGRATSVTAPVPPPFERVPSFDPYEYMHTARLARGPSLSGADPFSYMGPPVARKSSGAEPWIEPRRWGLTNSAPESQRPKKSAPENGLGQQKKSALVVTVARSRAPGYILQTCRPSSSSPPSRSSLSQTQPTSTLRPGRHRHHAPETLTMQAK